jgi:pimeloyl-ACP methyl ester carboxylesterase
VRIKDNFTRVARFLTPRYKVIIPDHIGFGESSHPQEADYSPPAQMERLRAFAGALNAGILHLGGSSMGGQIALTYAGQYPDEIASLWLLGPAGAWSAPCNEVFDIVEKTGYNPLLARNEEEFAQVFAFTMNDPPFVPRPILDVMAQARIKNYELEKRIFQQISNYSVEGHIAGLRIPSLIVFGDMDSAIPPSTAGILHKLLPDSQVIMMQGIGHLPMIERPRQSAMDYLEFRSGISSDR